MHSNDTKPTSSHAGACTQLARFLDIIAKLRDPNGGCPWDLELTLQSLPPYLIEESHEVADAVDDGPVHLAEELGDVLSAIGLFAQIGSEQGTFSFETVLHGINEKLVRRHPHVFGDVVVKDSDDVVRNWEEIKKAERGSSPEKPKGLLDGLPRSLPALQRSHRIGEKTAKVGFDWKSPDDVIGKVREEVDELVEAAAGAATPIQAGSAFYEEFGDVLFSLSQLARHLGINSEQCLADANSKFVNRFKKMEDLVRDEAPRGSSTSMPLEGLTVDQLEALWERAKAILKGS